MGKLNSDLSFTGTVANLTSYKMRGVEGTILRTKGGASKQKIKTHPHFESTRRLNAEMGGRGTGTKLIRKVLGPQKPLADYNFTGPLNALLKPIQELDTVSEFGQRNLLFTQYPALLEGFNLNKLRTFDSIIRNPFVYTLSKETLTAQVEIPELIPGINFVRPANYPFYSIIATLGIIPDLLYAKEGYKPADGFEGSNTDVIAAEWLPCLQESPATVMELKMQQTPPATGYTVLLTIGIRFGNMIGPDHIQQVKYSGAAKILGVK